MKFSKETFAPGLFKLVNILLTVKLVLRNSKHSLLQSAYCKLFCLILMKCDIVEGIKKNYIEIVNVLAFVCSISSKPLNLATFLPLPSTLSAKRANLVI